MALISKLTAIADAIRDKTETADTMTLDEMAENISGIESGNTDTDLADSIVNRSITEYSSDTVTSIGAYAFYYSSLKGVSLSAATKINERSFQYSTDLQSINAPLVTTIGNYAFAQNWELTDVYLPAVTSIGNYAFSTCTSLTAFAFGDDMISLTGISIFRYSTALAKVWLPSTITTITASAATSCPFYGCSSTLEIYTDVTDEDSIPEGWGTYWNYCASGSTLTVHYGSTYEEYEAA